MNSDLLIFIDRNGFGCFIIALCVLWAIERAVVAFINRHKPACDCDCCEIEHDDDDEEVVRKGGKVEEDE